MKFCMECGTKLNKKYLENEGDIPFCDNCNTFRFPVFNTAVSMIVMNIKKDKILLIKQYSRDFFILVAGYINKGENAEDCVVREVYEEVGMKVIEMNYNSSQYFERSNTLMLNFTCIVSEENLDGMTKEVDHAEWFSIEDARKNIKENSLAQKFLENYISNNQ